MEFLLPPQLKNDEGKTRKAGFELELAGIALDNISQHIVAIYGGEHQRNSAFDHEISNTRYGTFRVEVDAAVLKNQSWRKWLTGLGFDLNDLPFIDNLDELENHIARLAGKVVPYEVVTPPLAVDELAELDELRERLRDDMGQGTRASIVNAFGLHINPEAPSLSAESILRHIQAFLLLNTLIQDASDIDFSRKLTPYIKRFPEKYARKILQLDYKPDMQQLVDDYLEHNPTRNRPLDMLPLLAHVHGDEVIERCDEPDLIKPRPAFHYRLPNCLLDEPDWRIAEEWNRWLVVEKLADDRNALHSLIGRRR